MSWLRMHAWSFLTLCAALSIGLALGAGPLQGDTEPTRATHGPSSKKSLGESGDPDVFREAVTRSAAEVLVGGRLQGAIITLMVLPDAPPAAVSGLQDVIGQAGGDIAAVIQLAEDLIDPGNKTYVDSVASSSAEGVPAVSDIPADDTYARVGALLARAYVTSAQGVTPALDDVAVDIDSELQGSKLVTIEGDGSRRGSLVVVLTAGDNSGDELTEATHLIQAKLIVALGSSAQAVLVATTPGASEPGGLLDALAETAELDQLNVSALNDVDSAGGQLASVYALLATANGQSGSWGVIDGEPVLPPGLTAPR